MNKQAGKDRASTAGISFKKNAQCCSRWSPEVDPNNDFPHWSMPPRHRVFCLSLGLSCSSRQVSQMSSAASSVWVQKGRREHKARWFNPLFIGGRVQAGANSSGMVAEPWEKGSLLRLWTRVSEGQGSPLRILKSPSPSTLGEA